MWWRLMAIRFISFNGMLLLHLNWLRSIVWYLILRSIRYLWIIILWLLLWILILMMWWLEGPGCLLEGLWLILMLIMYFMRPVMMFIWYIGNNMVEPYRSFISIRVLISNCPFLMLGLSWIILAQLVRWRILRLRLYL